MMPVDFNSAITRDFTESKLQIKKKFKVGTDELPSTIVISDLRD